MNSSKSDHSLVNDDNYVFQLELKLNEVLSSCDYEARIEKSQFSTWKPGSKGQCTFLFKSKNSIVSLQSELGNINGVSFFAELFPDGMDEKDHIS